MAAASLVAACAAPMQKVVDPSVGASLAIQQVDINVPAALRDQIALNGQSFLPEVQAGANEVLIVSGEGRTRPARVAVSVTDIFIRPSKGSRAAGEYRVVDARTGRLITGPHAFSVANQTQSNASGGLAGALLGSVVKGIANGSPLAYRNHASGLGRDIGSRIRNELY